MYWRTAPEVAGYELGTSAILRYRPLSRHCHCPSLGPKISALRWPNANLNAGAPTLRRRIRQHTLLILPETGQLKSTMSVRTLRIGKSPSIAPSELKSARAGGGNHCQRRAKRKPTPDPDPGPIADAVADADPFLLLAQASSPAMASARR